MQNRNFEVKATAETLNAVEDRLSQKFAYTRFGDGEILMMGGWRGKDTAQYNSPDFVRELIEAFEISHPDYLVGLSAGMVREENMRPGLFAPFEDEKLTQIVQFFCQKKRSFYSPVAFHYTIVFHPDRFIQFLRRVASKRLLFVGGLEPGIQGIQQHVKTPIKQAYDSINEWYPKVENAIDKTDIVLLSLGPTAKVVQKRLWKHNISTIDVGSVMAAIVGDEHDPHTWLRLAKVEIEYFRSLLGDSLRSGGL